MCKKNFTELFSIAYDRSVTPEHIKSGFRKCGIFPFNPDAIDKKRLVDTESYSTTSAIENSASTTMFSDDSDVHFPSTIGTSEKLASVQDLSLEFSSYIPAKPAQIPTQAQTPTFSTPVQSSTPVAHCSKSLPGGSPSVNPQIRWSHLG